MNKTIIIYGPTVTGKTSLALKLAKKFNCELISADSRQVYKGLDIGSGKVSFDSKVEKHDKYWNVDGVKIHGFDLKYPNEQFTVVDFLNSTTKSIEQINKINKLPIIVGGTGFYINALISGIDSIGIPKNYSLRKKLEKLSKDDLYNKLQKLSPNRVKLMNESDRQNPRRLIRAIEIASSNYHPLANYQLSVINYQLIGLTAPNEYLFEKADKWIELRLKNGLVEEVGNLLSHNVNKNWLESLGLEYEWITKLVLNEIPYDSAVNRLKGDIHSLIRRQKTWFKKFKNIKVFDIKKEGWQKRIENEIIINSFAS